MADLRQPASPRGIEPGKALGHAVHVAGDIVDLVLAMARQAIGEIAAGDRIGRDLEAAEPPRAQPCQPPRGQGTERGQQGSKPQRAVILAGEKPRLDAAGDRRARDQLGECDRRSRDADRSRRAAIGGESRRTGRPSNHAVRRVEQDQSRAKLLGRWRQTTVRAAPWRRQRPPVRTRRRTHARRRATRPGRATLRCGEVSQQATKRHPPRLQRRRATACSDLAPGQIDKQFELFGVARREVTVKATLQVERHDRRHRQHRDEDARRDQNEQLVEQADAHAPR